MYPFERFSEPAKRVLTAAQLEAQRSHRSFIGTEHLLLGVLQVEDGCGARVLSQCGLQIDEVRSRIQAMLGRNERVTVQHIIPTSRVKEAIELAFAEARHSGFTYVGTEHLLLGIAVGDGLAAHVLQEYGASAEVIRDGVAALQREGVVEQGGGAPA